MSTHIRFNDDSAEEYQPTDSEDELTGRDRDLLKKARSKGQKYSDSEEEVFGVYQSDEDDDDEDDGGNESDLALSDVEGQGEDDDGIPDAKAWGKNKKHYYSTDYVDPDYGGYQGHDATLADLEEQEAKNLQSELAKNLDDDDFALDFMPKAVANEDASDSEKIADVIKTDVSELSKRQKLQLLMKESPELFGLIEDYEKRMTAVRDELFPVVKLYKDGKIKKSDAMDFMNSYFQIILNYSVNINMYLLLKAQKSTIQNHPVIKRLYQYRQLLVQMDPVFYEQIKPQLATLLEKASGAVPTIVKTNKKLLSILKTSKEAEESSTKRKRKPVREELKNKDNVPEDAQKQINAPESEEDDDGDLGEENIDGLQQVGEDGVPEDEDSRRAITYQMAKNKGLMPKRKKEQRNPRVKHRNKFRKANIRRKGAVREVRRETTRYGGEISGIKASVSKSIKLKS